ncbi:MAG: hypothetical protein QXG25_02745 [Nitrososphaerota archaeon]
MEKAKGEMKVKGRAWLKAHLQACLEKQVEVVLIKGEPIYGRLMGFDVESNPMLLIIQEGNNLHFINLERVERIRVAINQAQK